MNLRLSALALALALALVPRACGAAEREAAADTTGRAAIVALEQEGWERLGRGELVAGDSLFALALSRRRAAGPGLAAGEARSLSGLAEARRQRRRFTEAESLSTEGLARVAARRADPGARALEARLRETRANLFAERRQVDAALVEIDRALALGDSIVPADSVAIARQRAARGRVLVFAGRSGEALALFEETTRLQARVLGAEHPDLAATHYMASFAASEVGDYLAGRRHAERSVAIRERAFGPDHPFVAISLMGLGGARRDLGDYAGALAAYERAEAIQRKAAPPNPAALATTLSNKGGLYLTLGDGRRARQAYEETIALRDQAFGAGRGEDLFVAGRMAMALLLEGRPAEARARVERALAAAPQLDPISHPGTLAIHASAAYRLGDRAAARASLERAWALSDSLRGATSPRTLETLGQLAALDLADGRRADALRRATTVEEASRALLVQAAPVLSEREALELSTIRESGLGVMIALAADSIGLDPAGRRATLDALVRSRVLVLDRRAEEMRALPRGDSALAERVRALEDAGTALAALQAAVVRGEEVDPAALAEARRRREAAERELGEHSGSFRQARAWSDAGVDALQGRLGRGAALVSFARVLPPSPELVDLATRHPASARYVAFVTRAGEVAPRVVPLGPATRLEAVLERWLSALSTRPRAATAAAAERRCASLGRAVRRVAWDPLGAALAGADTVFWVPDGELHRIGLAALPSERAGRYLVDDGPLVVRLTAERDLVPRGDDPGTSPSGGLLAVGDVAFDGVPGGSSAAEALVAASLRAADAAAPRLRFAALPETGREVAAIAATWRDAAARDPSLGPVEVLTGSEAGEAAFRRAALGRRVLHLATHGFALTDPPAADTASALATAATTRAVGGVAAQKTAPAATGAGRTARRFPAVPGLALTGANLAGPPVGDDGFLTAGEIAGLDLAGTEWAVLSACETGLADPGAVEAVQGLHRAFRRAGVRTVIMSLWSVDDVSTAEWMDALYRARFADGRSTPAALREAHRSVLAARRAAGRPTHPFHWAGFVASGDPR